MSDLEDVGEGDLLEEEFARATKFIEHSHDRFEQKDLLKFYGFFKQATVGQCNVSKPGIFNLTGRSKWSAWNELGDMSEQEAMEGYIRFLTQLQPDWDHSTDGETDVKAAKGSWVSVSSYAIVEEKGGEKSIVDFIKEGNLEAVNENLTSAKTIINKLDDDGLGLVHWAADRGNVNVLRLLLQVTGSDVNLRDSGGQTALHYAASCGNRDCVQLLLDSGADRSLLDKEGESCSDVAFDEGIKQMLV
ncbi:acyl-CoA-binding domain-containing protein 6 [Wyeomyia smithii]|uniref:acyl-CoA-binding domain-containing protein 6 n=1 Tax=Wyeomyia smithii TaxID=174621 RepID=UPI002467D661|nr:acyl-CoA-binding domain-containing protein 6 [Wyeomyia smithii]XP_055534198.1 acyl-CoA-binding domain-containing protein 6 [Wyeomyia smithii]